METPPVQAHSVLLFALTSAHVEVYHLAWLFESCLYLYLDDHSRILCSRLFQTLGKLSVEKLFE